jgi:hypothetical protein
MTLHDPLEDLALSIEVASTRQEAWAVVEQFLKSATAKQISRRGHKQLAAIIGKRIAALPSDC